jgi:polyhydroxyalkanoate synthesis regulator phasin
MTVDTNFTTDTELRLIKIEEALTDFWRMLTFVVNKEQFNRLNVIRQKEMELLESRLDVVEADVADLESKYNDLL